MNYVEINDLLRNLVKDLHDRGYKKSKIGSLILGTSGYAPIIKMIECDDPVDQINIGIKPLVKVADTINCDLQLVFINRDVESDLPERIHDLNTAFFEELKSQLINRIEQDKVSGGPSDGPSISKKKAATYDSILNDIMNELDLDLDGSKLE
jgi:hypothetical protein